MSCWWRVDLRSFGNRCDSWWHASRRRRASWQLVEGASVDTLGKVQYSSISLSDIVVLVMVLIFTSSSTELRSNPKKAFDV